MQAFHNTSNIVCRDPKGAVELGTSATIRIFAWDDDVQSVTLRLWQEYGPESSPEAQALSGEKRVVMQKIDFASALPTGVPDSAQCFEAIVKPAATGLIWYRFELQASDGAVWSYGAQENRCTGVGSFAYGEPPSFQITCYEPRGSFAGVEDPSWYKGGVVYQIFPDRFARDANWHERTKQALAVPRNGVSRQLVEDWEKTPEYQRDANGRVTEWDFNGGSLAGIEEKLSYLENLGITALYLNPIYAASSNHRYDIADYLEVDPVLGTIEDFERLCAKAAEHGISIILDGVFNHCGADSKYFNKFSNYSEPGAVQQVGSAYDKWFTFHEDGTYESWWGVDALPTIVSDNPDYQEFICGENGVIRTWLRRGARGWRLDVADEISDSFIQKIRTAALAERSDAVIIGEVWEDASNKRAYGKLRQYLEGSELDGPMNYPLRKSILSFLMNEVGAEVTVSALEELWENYPHEAFYACLNVFGTHDKERLINVVAGAPAPDALSAQEQVTYRLSADQRGLSKARMWQTAVLQMTLPGVPSIYYGDEMGVEGFVDPTNRATMPWPGSSPRADLDYLHMYRNAIALRKTLPLLVDGSFEPFVPEGGSDDVLAFWRRPVQKDDQQEQQNKDASGICVLVNKSRSDAKTVYVSVPQNMQVIDVISGQAVPVKDGKAEVFLWQLGCTVLNVQPAHRLQKPLEPGMGVLAHITSLPADEDASTKPGQKLGVIGRETSEFIDFLAKSGQKYWQILPVSPTDEYGSPYAGISAFAGNINLLDQAAMEKIISECDDPQSKRAAEYQAFLARNSYWLDSYAAFRAIKDLLGEVVWRDWPKQYRSWSQELLERPELAQAIELYQKRQFAFDVIWSQTLAEARAKGIQIIGDMPMFVSEDSADVWAHPELFALDDTGHTELQAGAPADAFSQDGQLWGNPTYNWPAHKDEDYRWWIERFSRSFYLYDYTRLDHFIGFTSYYAIEQGKTAAEGSFKFGPGYELFEVAYKQLGPLPFIAEDLGAVTPAVRALLSQTGFPGMSVIQFADGDCRYSFAPAQESIVYSGTHDTQTLMGFVETRFTGGQATDESHQIFDHLMEQVAGASNAVVILPLQDVLGLSDDARMNIPGKAEGNWSWQVKKDKLMPEVVQKLQRFVELHQRRYNN